MAGVAKKSDYSDADCALIFPKGDNQWSAQLLGSLATLGLVCVNICVCLPPFRASKNPEAALQTLDSLCSLHLYRRLCRDTSACLPAV